MHNAKKKSAWQFILDSAVLDRVERCLLDTEGNMKVCQHPDYRAVAGQLTISAYDNGEGRHFTPRSIRVNEVGLYGFRDGRC